MSRSHRFLRVGAIGAASLLAFGIIQVVVVGPLGIQWARAAAGDVELGLTVDRLYDGTAPIPAIDDDPQLPTADDYTPVEGEDHNGEVATLDVVGYRVTGRVDLRAGSESEGEEVDAVTVVAALSDGATWILPGGLAPAGCSDATGQGTPVLTCSLDDPVATGESFSFQAEAYVSGALADGDLVEVNATFAAGHLGSEEPITAATASGPATTVRASGSALNLNARVGDERDFYDWIRSPDGDVTHVRLTWPVYIEPAALAETGGGKGYTDSGAERILFSHPVGAITPAEVGEAAEFTGCGTEPNPVGTEAVDGGEAKAFLHVDREGPLVGDALRANGVWECRQIGGVGGDVEILVAGASLAAEGFSAGHGSTDGLFLERNAERREVFDNPTGQNGYSPLLSGYVNVDVPVEVIKAADVASDASDNNRTVVCATFGDDLRATRGQDVVVEEAAADTVDNTACTVVAWTPATDDDHATFIGGFTSDSLPVTVTEAPSVGFAATGVAGAETDSVLPGQRLVLASRIDTELTDHRVATDVAICHAIDAELFTVAPSAGPIGGVPGPTQAVLPWVTVSETGTRLDGAAPAWVDVVAVEFAAVAPWRDFAALEAIDSNDDGTVDCDDADIEFVADPALLPGGVESVNLVRVVMGAGYTMPPGIDLDVFVDLEVRADVAPGTIGAQATRFRRSNVDGNDDGALGGWDHPCEVLGSPCPYDAYDLDSLPVDATGPGMPGYVTAAGGSPTSSNVDRVEVAAALRRVRLSDQGVDPAAYADTTLPENVATIDGGGTWTTYLVADLRSGDRPATIGDLELISAHPTDVTLLDSSHEVADVVENCDATTNLRCLDDERFRTDVGLTSHVFSVGAVSVPAGESVSPAVTATWTIPASVPQGGAVTHWASVRGDGLQRTFSRYDRDSGDQHFGRDDHAGLDRDTDRIVVQGLAESELPPQPEPTPDPDPEPAPAPDLELGFPVEPIIEIPIPDPVEPVEPQVQVQPQEQPLVPESSREPDAGPEPAPVVTVPDPPLVVTEPAPQEQVVAPEPPSVHTFGDQVWVDLNGDGEQGPNEPGVADVTVELLDGSTVVDATTTSADGGFSFNVAAGAGPFTVRVDSATTPRGTTAGADADGGDDYVIAAGVADADRSDLDFAIRTEPQLISGTVFTDHDLDGLLDDGEAGDDEPLAAVTVELTGTDFAGREVSRSTSTALDGVYRFDGVLPGTYVVSEVQPPGRADGPDRPGTGGVTSSPADDQLRIVLPWGTSSVGNNFTELASSLSGSVTVAGTPISDVRLTIVGETFALEQVSASADTDADGRFRFTNLAGGIYTLTQTQPPGFVDGPDEVGSAGGVAADPGDEISVIILDEGIQAVGYDFTEGEAATVSGEVRLSTGTGVAGVTVALAGVDEFGATVAATTETDADGDYVFSGLVPGTYSVTEEQPPGYLDGSPAQLSGDPSADTSTTDVISNLVVDVGDTNAGNDFVNAGGSISGVTFLDMDENGDHDLVADLPLPGMELTLTGFTVSGPVDPVVISSGADGAFQFVDLQAGTYTIEAPQPAGYLDGPSLVGSAGGERAASETGNVIGAITVGAGVDASGYGFGEQPAATLEGTVWVDDNRDGEQGADELDTIAGVEVTVTNADGLDVAVLLTDDDGRYEMSGLSPGSYTVSQAQPEGYGSTTPNEVEIDAPPQGELTVDFGEDLATVTGFVWDDLDRNGTHDPDEPGLGGVTVKLVDPADGSVAVTTISADGGTYQMNGVGVGGYQVEFVNPFEKSLTEPRQDSVGSDSTTDSDADWVTGRTEVFVVEGPPCGECLYPEPPEWDAGFVEAHVDLGIETAVTGELSTTGDTVDVAVTPTNASESPVDAGASVVVDLPPTLAATQVQAEGYDTEVNGQRVRLTTTEPVVPGEVPPPVNIEATLVSEEPEQGEITAAISAPEAAVELAQDEVDNAQQVDVPVDEPTSSLPVTGSGSRRLAIMAALLLSLGLVVMGVAGRDRLYRVPGE
ncbi:MAG: SdrD B-like domain-containing protein [Actinomycetota bacterium]